MSYLVHIAHPGVAWVPQKGPTMHTPPHPAPGAASCIRCGREKDIGVKCPNGCDPQAGA